MYCLFRSVYCLYKCATAIGWSPGSYPLAVNKYISNHILGAGIWHDMFVIQNTNWLWLVSDVAAMNSDKLLCGVFGMYPSFVTGILKLGGEINFCLLCNEKSKCSDY